ncbi:phosphoenolpyruvate synthase [Patescibacteria group bacterium]|nr:phosphoenolpyruvate synthase [Patescibacteria group bacterium]
MQYTKLFKDTSKDDIAQVGGKAANLGEMTQAGFRVPSGFTVTSDAYLEFLKVSQLTGKIRKLLGGLNYEDSKTLQEVSRQIRALIEKAIMPPDIKQAILQAYHKMSRDKSLLVAVRSSATAEDLPEASFAGQQQTFLNVSGDKDLLQAVQGCWSSLFTARAIYYREHHGFDHFQVAVAVPVQKMIQSDVSGIMFTVDPITNNPEVLTIEAVFGLGEGIVSGSMTPDQYSLQKKPFKIANKRIVNQEKMLTRKGEVAVSKAWQKKQKLSDKFIKELAQQGLALEKHYQFPQDIEWGVEKKKVYILQTRPVTTLDIEKVQRGEETITQIRVDETQIDTLLEGIGASPGIAVGKVHKIRSANEIDKIKKGEILVTIMTTPDFVPAMKKAAAIITNEGGATCHAAIVSRELGVPCIVGTEIATQILKTGEIITADGRSGKVYQGDLSGKITDAVVPAIKTNDPTKTATKVYVNLAEPDLAEETSQLDVDGVGLLRAEFMIAQIGKHPEKYIKEGQGKIFSQKLYEGISIFAKAFTPRPVIYRATDFKTNEYRNLKGGVEFESVEANPMLGVRGALRYILKPKVFELELEAIKRVRRYYKNLWLMLPFVRTVDELIEIKKLMAAHDLHRTSSFKLFLMVEVPSNVILLEKFIGTGIDGVSIGSNDLTQLILGADRDNPKLGDTFNEMNPAVLWAIERTVKESQKHGIMCSICGQAPSVYPELVEMLVSWGITSISVSPDVVGKTRLLVAEAEENVVRNR